MTPSVASQSYAQERANPLWSAVNPILSILIPFHTDDPIPLLDGLITGAKGLAPGTVEVVVVDDATPQETLFARVAQHLSEAPIPALAIRLARNLGRSGARNHLLQRARGAYFLLLDADMSPDAPDFLQRYLDLAARERPDMAFGGFTVARAPRSRATALHRAHSERYDCLPANRRGPEHVYTSNVLVRREVLELAPFDEGFIGWGWEDVDWGLRAQQKALRLIHLDNTATHLGLDDPDTLLRKSASAGANFRRLIERHPEASRHWPARRAAEAMRRFPIHSALRPLLAAIVRDRAGLVPMAIRVLALKFWRASHAAEALS